MIDADNIDSKFICCICQEIFKPPVLTIPTCNHCFCKQCIVNMVRADNCSRKGKAVKHQCPFCKQEFTLVNLFENRQLYFEISKALIKCKCGQILKLTEYNQHSDICAYNKTELNSAIKNATVKDAKPSVNRQTFNCTVCKARNFDREGMLRHIFYLHPNVKGVCPICVVQPWGDPTYQTFLAGHCYKRHQFEYDETVDYNADEDKVLREVLERSKSDK